MPAASIPLNENIRLQDLWSYNILDSEREKPFDDLVELAAQIYGCPVASITFIDKDRQWFKARKGDNATEGPREEAMCGHTILQDECIVVEDATLDSRFADSPFVRGAMKVRFYASAPIVSTAGNNIGSVCVVDIKPRNLTLSKANALRIIAGQVTQLLELRRKNEMLQKQATQMVNKEKKIAQNMFLQQENERMGVARELHENFAQSLAAVKLYLDYAKQSEDIREHFLSKSIDRIAQIIQEVRNLSKSIVPSTMLNIGFKEAISDLLLKYAKEEGWSTHFMCSQKVDMVTAEKGLILFRIVEEQLKNIRKHARATTVVVDIKLKNGIQLSIKDDGDGVEVTTFQKGDGFNNMVTRIEHLQGTINLQGHTFAKGCTLVAEIPA